MYDNGKKFKNEKNWTVIITIIILYLYGGLYVKIQKKNPSFLWWEVKTMDSPCPYYSFPNLAEVSYSPKDSKDTIRFPTEEAWEKVKVSEPPSLSEKGHYGKKGCV